MKNMSTYISYYALGYLQAFLVQYSIIRYNHMWECKYSNVDNAKVHNWFHRVIRLKHSDYGIQNLTIKILRYV